MTLLPRTPVKNPGDRILLGFWILLVVGIALGAFVSAWLLLAPLILGYLLAVLLSPLIETFERHSVPRGIGTAIVLGSLVGVFATAAIFATPFFFHQIQSLRDHSAQYLQAASQRLSGFLDLLSRLVPAKELEATRELAQRKLSSQGSPFDSIQDLMDALPWLETLLLTLVVAFFLLARGAEIRRSLLSIVPNRYFEMTLRLMHRLQLQTAAYLRGQSLDSLANGILVASALAILDVPYAPFLGAFAGIANAVPLLGPIAGGVPALFLALVGATSTPWWAIVAVLFAIHMLDNLWIYPSTVGGSLQLPPWVVILGVALGSHMGGILGMLVAVPLIGLARGFVVELHDNLRGFKIL